MDIIINNIRIEKNYLLELLANNQKLLAIKHLKERSNLGLKECKNVIDNLESNPEYYDGAIHTINSDIEEIDDELLTESPKQTNYPPRKSKYLKDNNNSNTYIVIFILFCIAVAVYFFLNN